VKRIGNLEELALMISSSGCTPLANPDKNQVLDGRFCSTRTTAFMEIYLAELKKYYV